MDDENKKVTQETESLKPIKEKDRIMGWGSNTMLWRSSGTDFRHGLEERLLTISRKNYLDLIISGCFLFYFRYSKSGYPLKDLKE